jgi:hypothetical protein
MSITLLPLKESSKRVEEVLWSVAELFFLLETRKKSAPILIPRNDTFDNVKVSVVDPCYFGTDPDPRICASDQWIWILLFSSLTFKTPTKKILFYVFLLVTF